MKPQTLMIAVQSVASEIKSLDLLLEAGQVDSETELSLVSYHLALSELKGEYELALKEFSGFPSYEEILNNIES
jgi:hypothetical protein